MHVGAALVWLACLCVCTFVQAECPNGCSGNGDCMAKDMCNCYQNYEGNDCADRTCLFGRAHVDTPKGDINMDQSRLTTGWILANSQRDPSKTWEYFNPAAAKDEAHFYMECSNKGICDRTTGLCECFDGYEGNGCHRTTCPNKCSDHGTCESIRELGMKARGTLFGREAASGPGKYDLWDSNSTYGCRCDPWFFGPDCAKRNCKVGIDPLYKSVGTPMVETFVIHAYLDGSARTTPAAPVAADFANSWVRLRVFDYYGESYITTPIPITLTVATDVAAVKAAFLAIPNLTFRDITCESIGDATGELTSYLSHFPATNTAGLSVICSFFDNPGKMRIPEVVSYKFQSTDPLDVAKAFVVTTAQQGQDDEWLTTETTILGTSTSADKTSLPISYVSKTPIVGTTGVPQLVKVGPHIVAVTGVTETTAYVAPVGSTPATMGAGTMAYVFESDIDVSNEPVFVTTAPSSGTDFVLTKLATAAAAVAAAIGDISVGDDFFTFTVDPSTAIPTGTLLFYENQFFTVQDHYNDGAASPAQYYARIDKPFGGNAKDGTTGLCSTASAGAKPLIVTLPSADLTKIYNYVSECSGRGMCSYETGVCTCFKGYTNDNCNTQNILAL